MNIGGMTIGFALTGSHCTYGDVYPEIENMVKAGVRVIPIVSNTVVGTSTRFGEAGEWVQRIEAATGAKAIASIPEAEPLGPAKPLDCLVIAPCTGSSISRLANAQTDSPVLMAAKATMRNNHPVVLAISTNDGLGLNAVNIGRLLAAKNVFFVPFGQDDPVRKTNSLVAKMNLIIPAVEAALDRRQLQPLLVAHEV